MTRDPLRNLQDELQQFVKHVRQRLNGLSESVDLLKRKSLEPQAPVRYYAHYRPAQYLSEAPSLESDNRDTNQLEESSDQGSASDTIDRLEAIKRRLTAQLEAPENGFSRVPQKSENRGKSETSR